MFVAEDWELKGGDDGSHTVSGVGSSFISISGTSAPFGADVGMLADGSNGAVSAMLKSTPL